MVKINELRTPFRPDGFDFSNLEALNGTRCLECNEHYFPARPVCLKCLSSNIEPIKISKKGKIYSFTIIHRAPEAFQVPYGCGWIITEDGIKLWAMFKGPIENLKVGLPMKIIFDNLGEQTIYYFEPEEVN